MESKIKLFGHPIHPMLIVFPLGLLATAVIFDILYLIYNNPELTIAAYWMIIAGIVGGLIAALFGFIDWLGIPGGTRAKTIGLTHAVGNVAVLALFALSWFIRGDNENFVPGGAALLFSFAGVLLSLFTGWLGSEMVYRLAVGVDRGANLDAASSLSGEPAITRQEMGAARGQAIPATGHRDDEDEDTDLR